MGEVKANKPKKYTKTTLIPCRSITNGELLVQGTQTGYIYRWPDYGAITEMEHQDLDYDARTQGSASFSKRPCFIVMDDDFVAMHPELEKLYASMYSAKDIRGIFDLSKDQMIKTIDALPTGVKDAVKGQAATMIANKTLDSVSKIKALDEYFGTQLLLTLVND